MKYPLFTQVKLQIDLPAFNLKKGAIGTIVEFYDLPIGQEPGYSFERLIPNDTVEVSESHISAILQTPLTTGMSLA
jgi:hypothetical protein